MKQLSGLKIEGSAEVFPKKEAATPAYAPKGDGISTNAIFRDTHSLATPQPINKPYYVLPKP
jgi:hypothetical protein